ncbi:hypothetical protein WR30_18385 [Burkholderia contaminans FFH2055]|nr:hypothetical protein WR30_18385 [Burkholderia contaminans FFH2055]
MTQSRLDAEHYGQRTRILIKPFDRLLDRGDTCRMPALPDHNFCPGSCYVLDRCPHRLNDVRRQSRTMRGFRKHDPKPTCPALQTVVPPPKQIGHRLLECFAREHAPPRRVEWVFARKKATAGGLACAVNVIGMALKLGELRAHCRVGELDTGP